MIAKFSAFLCLLGMARASGWGSLGYSTGYASGLGYSSGLGYGLGYSGYVAPAYTAPIVTKAVIPAVSYAPAISTVSRYQVHSTPIVKTYAAPVAYSSYVSPYSVSYGHGYGGLGYSTGAYGYGSKYLW